MGYEGKIGWIGRKRLISEKHISCQGFPNRFGISIPAMAFLTM